MNPRGVDRTRHNLHWVFIRAVAANVLEVTPTVHDQLMPMEKKFFGKRCVKLPVKGGVTKFL